jgi:hypothetical protein
VRQALDFDTSKAILTVIIGWVIVFIVTLAVSVVFGPAQPVWLPVWVP